MRETVVFAPGANATELIRTMARHGKNTFNVRIVNANELARMAIVRCGKNIGRKYISGKEEAAVYASILRNGNVTYFRTYSYTDAENIAKAIDSARSLIQENESESFSSILSEGEFKDKNDAIIDVYNQYQTYLEDNGCIDNIGIIRKAIDEECTFDADFVIFDDFSLTPLEKKLIDTVSGSSYKVTDIAAFAGKEKKKSNIEKFVKTYGASNEVEWIIGDILEKNISLDKCTIAVTDTREYSQLIYDLCVSYGLNATFGCGLPISNSNPATLIYLLNEWNTNGFNGIDALREILYSEAFDIQKLISLFGERKIHTDELITVAGKLRLSFDRNSNEKKIKEYRESVKDDEISLKYLECAEILAGELQKGPVYLISVYSRIRQGYAGRIDRSSVQIIKESLDTYFSYSHDFDLSEIAPKILSRAVCAENSREGCLYVTSIDSATSSVRENMYIAGLSASVFPGSPMENYLMLDSDYRLFGDNEDIPSSEKVVTDKTESLYRLLNYASTNDNRIVLSWSGYNLAGLKDVNPSSVLFDIYSMTNGGQSTVEDFEKDVLETGFFGRDFGKDVNVGRAYADGKKLVPAVRDVIHTHTDVKREYIFSPSQIEQYIQCPKKFFLANVLGIEDKKEDEPFNILNANDFGNLVHSSMKYLAENAVEEDDFIAYGRKLFKDFLLSRPALHETDIQRMEEEYIDCLQTAYKSNERNEVLSAEEKLVVEHPAGITIRGTPDRIEMRPDGTYIIADFKTGKTIKHLENDPRSCIQTLLYAFMVKEKFGYDIKECEYRYVRSGNIVKCKYNKENEEELRVQLSALHESLKNNDFPICSESDKKESCKYCTYADICGVNAQEVEADE